jgi:putative peptidoglycan lipid II flippase
MMLMLNVPATAGLIALAMPIVDLLFRRGQFAPGDTAATAAAVLFYAPGLIGYSTVKLAVPTFYALKESRTPVIVSALTVGLNVVLNVTLVRVMGYRGLALGTAIAALFNASALLWLLSRRLDGIDGSRVAMAFCKIAVASAVMAAAAWIGERMLRAAWPGSSTLWRLARLTVVIALALGVLAAAAKALRIHEFNEAMRTVFAKLAGRRQPASPSL